MNTFRTLVVLAVLTVAVFTPGVTGAAENAPADQHAQQLEEQARKDYERALEAARAGQDAARQALEMAREEQTRAEQDRAGSEQLRAQAEAEREAMREELSRVHEDLRRASREVARVHRDLERVEADREVTDILINLGDKAVIGVVLGESTNLGVPVLGVSPDGPADRAGIQQGDVIIAMMGKALADDKSGNARAVLHEVMEGVKAGDELLIAVNREGKQVEYTVVAEKREPFAWQSMLRLPSVPHSPSAPSAAAVPGAPPAAHIIQRIRVPEIAGEALESQIERIREDIDRARVVIEATGPGAPGAAPRAWEYRIDSLSDFGGDALHETNLWFGLPVTRGLQFAEIDAGLGTYFKTDRGVLVVKANEGNDLKLVSGDVILQIGDKEVNKPADVMRALREWDSGETIRIEIKRERKNETLDVVLPERKLGADFVPFNQQWEFSFQTDDN